MTPKIKAPRTVPAGLNDALSPSEQAHMDSGGADALAPPTPDEDGAAAPVAAATGVPTDDGTGAAEVDTPVADPAPVATDAKPRMVPHAALHEEREARKAAEKRASMLEERTGMILEALRTGTLGAGPSSGTKADTPTVPEFKADPGAHVLGRLDRADQVINGLAQLLMGQQQATQQKSVAESAWGRARLLEDEFRARTPDHDTAMAHLKRTRHGILSAMGVSDAVERERQIAQEMQHIAQVAAQENRNPAEMLYTMAQAIGYRAAGGAPASGQPAADAAARLATAAAGQRQAGTLGTVRGTGPAPLTTARLIEMSDAEFARAIATPEGRALLGA